MMVGLDPSLVLSALDILESQPRGDSRSLDIVRDYSSVSVSEKVLRIVMSYTGYVNRVVWKKY